MHRSVTIVTRDVRDRSSPPDLGVLERLVAKVHVVTTTDDGMDRRLCAVYQADSGVCCRDRGTDGYDFLRKISEDDVKWLQCANTFRRYFSGDR